MSSEAFHLLSRGGVAFDKSKSKYQVDLFNTGVGVNVFHPSRSSCTELVYMIRHETTQMLYLRTHRVEKFL